MNCKLALIYESPNFSTPLKIATIADQDLVTAAARRALENSEAAVEALSGTDKVLAQIQQEEARKLKAALRICLPNFAGI
jgi:hypothetical protein